MTDELAAVFDEWAVWERTRRIYAPSPHVQSIIGSLVGPRGHDRPDAPCDALMPYLHIAVRASDEHGPLIVAYHYRSRKRITKDDGTTTYKGDPVKRIAQQLGISVRQFYRKLPEARQAIYRVATRIKAEDANSMVTWYRMDQMDD